MVKINTFTRTSKDSQRDTKLDLHKVNRIISSEAHPMFQAREYQRAVVAAKVSKIFAKPFIAALQGHTDGICSLKKSLKDPNLLISGSFSGEILLWDLALRKYIGRADCFNG